MPTLTRNGDDLGPEGGAGDAREPAPEPAPAPEAPFFSTWTTGPVSRAELGCGAGRGDDDDRYPPTEEGEAQLLRDRDARLRAILNDNGEPLEPIRHRVLVEKNGRLQAVEDGTVVSTERQMAGLRLLRSRWHRRRIAQEYCATALASSDPTIARRQEFVRWLVEHGRLGGGEHPDHPTGWRPYYAADAPRPPLPPGVTEEML